MKYLLLFISLVVLTTKPVFAEGWTKTTLENPFITTLETTPWGILAGEFDNRIWLNPPPFNGLYITKDLGATWTTLGLETKGIVDIAYTKGNIYAATYYSYAQSPPGGYMSKDEGKTWQFLNKTISPTKIAANSKAILLGTAHSGLWTTFDEGATWEQKIGNGLDNTKVHELQSTEELSIATTLNKVYRSLDHAETWEEIPFFEGNTITAVTINENIALAGTERAPGLYRSTDYGETWLPVFGWKDHTVSSLIYHNNRFYTGTTNPVELHSSNDLGVTWEKIELTTQTTKTKSLSGILSKHNWIFALLNDAVYKHAVINPINSLPFLDIPWSSSYQNEALDKTTSFFDHEYPLLGYSYHQEPVEARKTTLNYLGLRETEPDMYYSSHDGYDYALPYGTPILAAAPGYAYYHYCAPCGYTIKINHTNGYQTTYMHLQKDSLITTGYPVWVEKGTQIGLVGMTGNTTGPHLHFAVVKGDNISGRIDPYGWQAGFGDPWENYSWTDILGNHEGTKSSCLWNNPTTEAAHYVAGDISTIYTDNKIVEIIPPKSVWGMTVLIKPYIKPKLLNPQQYLKYIINTSLLITAADYLGNTISNLTTPAKIEIDFTDSLLDNVILHTLKIYALNKNTNIWEPLPTVVDLVVNKLIGISDHLSHFAAFGEKIDSTPPITTLTTQGQKQDDWFTEYPTITLKTTDPQDKTFYAIDSEHWVEYTQPFVVNKEGVTTIEFRSIDIVENIEPTQSQVLKIDTSGKFKKQLLIRNSVFTLL